MIKQKDIEYWKNLYVEYHGHNIDMATLFANQICQKKEIERLLARIIKLEKSLKKLRNG